MTKKSTGRVMRDKLKENTSIWDDLEGIYIASREALLTANSSIAEAYKQPGITDNVPNKKDVIVALRGLDNDLKLFFKDLEEIHSKHKGKTGTTTDELGTVHAIQIFELYTAFDQRYHSSISPTIIFLAEQAGAALQIMVDANKAIDPNVITDIEVKDVVIESKDDKILSS